MIAGVTGGDAPTLLHLARFLILLALGGISTGGSAALGVLGELALLRSRCSRSDCSNTTSFTKVVSHDLDLGMVTWSSSSWLAVSSGLAPSFAVFLELSMLIQSVLSVAGRSVWRVGAVLLGAGEG